MVGGGEALEKLALAAGALKTGRRTGHPQAAATAPAPLPGQSSPWDRLGPVPGDL